MFRRNFRAADGKTWDQLDDEERRRWIEENVDRRLAGELKGIGAGNGAGVAMFLGMVVGLVGAAASLVPWGWSGPLGIAGVLILAGLLVFTGSVVRSAISGPREPQRAGRTQADREPHRVLGWLLGGVLMGSVFAAALAFVPWVITRDPPPDEPKEGDVCDPTEPAPAGFTCEQP